jgi:hypothetical protein
MMGDLEEAREFETFIGRQRFSRGLRWGFQ